MSNAIAKFKKRKRRDGARLPWDANDVLRQVPLGKFNGDYWDRPFPGGIGAQPGAETTLDDLVDATRPMCEHGRRGGIGCPWCLGVNDMVDPEPIF